MSDNATDVIRKLIEICRDGETGYLHAAAVANDAELKSYLKKQSLERAQFRVELTEALKKLGESSPDRSGSAAGMLHRAWFALKDAMGGGDRTLMESVEQGENRANQAYANAVATELPAEIHELVRNQQASVKAAYDRILAWRNQKAA
jgi:uncharacterized protein (TIGR02284 family)